MKKSKKQPQLKNEGNPKSVKAEKDTPPEKEEELAGQVPEKPIRQIAEPSTDWGKASYREVYPDEDRNKLQIAIKTEKDYLDKKQQLYAELLMHLDDVLRTSVPSRTSRYSLSAPIPM